MENSTLRRKQGTRIVLVPGHSTNTEQGKNQTPQMSCIEKEKQQALTPKGWNGCSIDSVCPRNPPKSLPSVSMQREPWNHKNFDFI